MKNLKIALVDDHRSVRKGTELLIKAFGGMDVTLSVDNGNELLKRISEPSVDVVVMDIEMPYRNGAETTRILSIKYPGIKVIAYTLHREKNKVYEMLSAGAKGFVWKGCDAEELKIAVEEVMKNKTYIGQNILKGKQQLSIRYSTKEKIIFTEREEDILKGVLKGLKAKDIGKELGISSKTVENHKKSIFRKTGTNSTTGLIIYAVSNGYYSSP